MTEENSPQKTGGGSNDKTMAILAHALGIVTYFIGSLIIYLVTEKEGYVKNQAKEALNFQITVAIAIIVGSILIFIGIGVLLIWAVSVANLILCIMAAIAASKGEDYKYPVAIRLIK